VVELVAGDDIAIYYVNLFEVGHTPFDFTISAARLPAKHRPEVIAEAREEKVLRRDVEVQLVFPANVIPALIVADARTRLSARHTGGDGR
jgi:hypothetical protein